MEQPSEPPLVSVIVPTRNSARFLVPCLDSIVHQTYPSIELLVVDNFSTDATREIAASYTPLIFQTGPERSAQVNFGAQHASGEFVYKVDSDFVLHPQVVERCVQQSAKGYDAIVVHNSPDVSVGWIARVRKFEVDMYKYDLTHSGARFVRRRVYDAIGGFDERVTAGEDYDFQNKLNRGGYRTGFIEPEAVHLGEPTSFWRHMIKYYLYGVDFVTFADLNPKESRQQLAFVRGVYLRHWREFIKHPVLASTFLVYNTCKFVFGAAGFVVGRLRKQRPVAEVHS